MIQFTDLIPPPSKSASFATSQVPCRPVNDSFVRVKSGNNILIDMQYVKDGIPFAVSNCYMRRDVYRKLIRVAGKLPSQYKLKILDAWRPLVVQEFLYQKYEGLIRERFQHLPKQQLIQVINSFVLPPFADEMNPPVHTTGGAIDLTILDETGKELDMGTAFDDFSEKAHTRYFDSDVTQVTLNRRLLYHAMISEGFTNLPSEWWHYDYGTSIWAYYANDFSKYTGVFTEDELISKIQEGCKHER